LQITVHYDILIIAKGKTSFDSGTEVYIRRAATPYFLREGIYLDLKGNQITVKELLDHEGAKNVLQRLVPQLLNHPMLGMAKGMSLEKVLSMVGSLVSQEQIQNLLDELRKV